ncbi:hypothetical protein ACI65C_004748 [Semiaphis heraclei]
MADPNNSVSQGKSQQQSDSRSTDRPSVSWESLELLRLIPYLMMPLVQSEKHAVSSLKDDSGPSSTKPSSDTVTSDDTGNWLSSIPDNIRPTGNTKRSKPTTSNTCKRRRLSNGHRAVPHDPWSCMPEISTTTSSNAHTATFSNAHTATSSNAHTVTSSNAHTATSSNAHTATSSDAQEARGVDQQARSIYGEDNETTGYPPYISIWTPD